MNTKQKTMLGIVGLLASILVVVTIISAYPFALVPDNGGGGGNGDYVPPEDAPDAPDAPILKTIIPFVSYDGEIRLDWDDVSDADRYVVYRKKGDGFYELLGESITTNHYDDLLLDNGVYYYKLKAGNSIGDYSDFSNEKGVTVQIPGVPEKPFMNELTYEIIGDTIEIYLDWEEVDCDSYNVYRSVGGGNYILIEEDLTSTSYSEVLTEVGMYMYKVSAVNTYGESELSVYVIIEITEDGAPPPSEEPTNYIVPVVIILIFGALALTTVILAKKKKK